MFSIPAKAARGNLRVKTLLQVCHMHRVRASGKFFERVYALVARIPPGKVMTYGQIAAWLDGECSARYVGYAMSSAPEGRNLPCHRVVNRLGQMAPGAVFGGEERQRRLLEEEGVVFRADGRVDLVQSLYSGGRPEE